MQISPDIEALIQLFARLPGLGPRSAKRLVLSLLTDRQESLGQLITSLQHIRQHIQICNICGNIDVSMPCMICQDTQRPYNNLCVVASIADLWALEKSFGRNMRYHVLGGILSPIDGIGPEDLRIHSLHQRLKEGQVTELILALPATVDGQTTAHYLATECQPYQLTISHLAHGIPMGGELDYLDEGTLQAAFAARRQI